MNWDKYFNDFLFSAPLGFVSNFKVTSYTSSSIAVEWSPVAEAAEYKLSWSTGKKSSLGLHLFIFRALKLPT